MFYLAQAVVAILWTSITPGMIVENAAQRLISFTQGGTYEPPPMLL